MPQDIFLNFGLPLLKLNAPSLSSDDKNNLSPQQKVRSELGLPYIGSQTACIYIEPKDFVHGTRQAAAWIVPAEFDAATTTTEKKALFERVRKYLKENVESELPITVFDCIYFPSIDENGACVGWQGDSHSVLIVHENKPKLISRDRAATTTAANLKPTL